MPVKFNSTFYSDKGAEYIIEIHQSTFVGTPTEFTCQGIDIKYDVGGDEDNRFLSLIHI